MMHRLIGLTLLALSCTSEPYVPVPITDPELVRLMNRYGFKKPHYTQQVTHCRFMDGRKDSFTAQTADGQTVEGSICDGADMRGPRIELH